MMRRGCSRCSSLPLRACRRRARISASAAAVPCSTWRPQTQLELQSRPSCARRWSGVGRVTPLRWLAPLAGPIVGYRRRARLGAKFVAKKGRVLVGFRERLAPYVSAIGTLRGARARRLQR